MIINNYANKPLLITGDLNAQHKAWGSHTNNANGNVLHELIEDNFLFIINTGTPTRMTRPSEGASAPDVSVCSDSIAANVTWTTLEPHGLSDHLPCLITVNDLNQTVPYNRDLMQSNKFSYKNADWDRYQKFIRDSFATDQSPIDYDSFFQTLQSAAEEAIPRQKVKEAFVPSNPWWDSECSDKIKIKRLAFQKYSENRTVDNYIDYRKIRAQTRRFLKDKKKTSFIKFCSEINPRCPIKQVWQKVRKFKNAIVNRASHQNLNQNVAHKMLKNLTNQPGAFTGNPALIYSPENVDPFTMQELNYIINKKTKDSAPGLDQMSYSMIRNLPEEAKAFLLDTYNNVVTDNTPIPKHWKEHLIIPIPKSNNSTSNASFRPICLSPVITKIFESLIKIRMEWFLEHHNKLTRAQTGFRKGFGVQDNLVQVTSNIASALANKQGAIMVTLDVTAAYDNISTSMLFHKMINLDIPYQYCATVQKLLCERKLSVKDPYSNHIVGPATSHRGVPQGSPLSPLLYNIYTNDLVSVVPEPVQILLYADDIVLLVTGQKTEHMIRLINQAIDNIITWLTNNALSLSVNKSHALHFNRCNNNNPADYVKIGSDIIVWSKEIKYLGVIFDRRLSFENHIEYVESKALKNLNIIRFLTRVWWGGHPQSLIMLHKALILSHIDYGSILLTFVTKRNTDKLEKIQYASLRVCLGLMKSTPTNVILSEAGLTDLTTRRQWLATKFVLKSASMHNNPTFISVKKWYRSYIRNQSRIRTKYTPPLITAYSKVNPLTQSLETLPLAPIFLFPLQTQLFPINYHKTPLNKHENNNPQFLEILNKKYNGASTFYTDASVDSEGKTGIGIHSPEHKIFYLARIPRMPIASAEMVAIFRAISLIRNCDTQWAAIFSDSLSALQKIKRVNLSIKVDYLTLMIKSKLKTLQQQNKRLNLTWIPSHTNITGNDKADLLAKAGSKEVENSRQKIHYTDFLPSIKSSFWTEWTSKWNILSTNKGVNYKSFNPSPNKKPWFSEMKSSSRQDITTTIRMRTGHCLTPSHMHRIGVKRDANCECGEEGSLSHILLDCRLNKTHSDVLYRQISDHLKLSPIHLNDILSNVENFSIMQALSNFLLSTSIKL